MTTTDPTPSSADPASASGPTVHGIAEAVYRRRWWTLAVLCLSLLIVFVGNSSLNVAIPTLSRELNASESQLQWVIAVYSLVFAGLGGDYDPDRLRTAIAALAPGSEKSLDR